MLLCILDAGELFVELGRTIYGMVLSLLNLYTNENLRRIFLKQ